MEGIDQQYRFFHHQSTFDMNSLLYRYMENKLLNEYLILLEMKDGIKFLEKSSKKNQLLEEINKKVTQFYCCNYNLQFYQIHIYSIIFSIIVVICYFPKKIRRIDIAQQNI
ncbi:unnamed protein product [Paramecium sonneborni]|uniref:Transmembrane protein n=1 Tax=Paramecium sonneborni TaxID=65129 RepID=A0A8S1RN74_9CILI|nr:unnamed protein product [Paramecium sonneborni]